MPLINDPRIDELSDADGRFFGRGVPAQGWLKPVSCELRHPGHDLLEGGLLVDKRGPTDLNFLVQVPWTISSSPARHVRPHRRIFEDFLSLSTGSREQIHGFASKFGPLQVYGRVELKGDHEHL